MYQWLALIAIIIVPYILLRKFFPPPPSGKVCGHLEILHNFGKITMLSKVRTSLVLGSGGHTAELLGLVGASTDMKYTAKDMKRLIT